MTTVEQRIAAAPSPAPAPPRTSGRDTGIDLVRAMCVIAVVILHALMVGVTVSDAGPVFANASEGSWWITPLSWMLQVMPLFFVIGGFAGWTAYRRSRVHGGTASSFVAGRLQRLLVPAAAVIAVVGGALIALAAAGVLPICCTSRGTATVSRCGSSASSCSAKYFCLRSPPPTNALRCARSARSRSPQLRWMRCGRRPASRASGS